MIYFPESAARLICKMMRDIHMHTQTYLKEKWTECITSSVQGFLTHWTKNTIRGVLPGMILSKKQWYIRTKLTPAMVGLISSLPART